MRASERYLSIRQERGGPRLCQICEGVSRGERTAIAIGKTEIVVAGRRRAAAADGVTKCPA
jgi:hypothetical protein